MSESSRGVVVACDGAALRNPNGPAGWAWYASEKHWAAGGVPQASNNLMELMALLQFLNATADLPPTTPIRVLLDSTYVKDSVTVWARGWERNGWRTRNGDPVKNVEPIKKIVKHLKSRPGITLEWVRGHSGHPLNEAADTRANAAAHAIRLNQPVDTGPGWRHTPTTPRFSWPTPPGLLLDDVHVVQIAGHAPEGGGRGWWFWATPSGSGGAGIRPLPDTLTAHTFAILSTVRTAPPSANLHLHVPAPVALLFTPAPTAPEHTLTLLHEIHHTVTTRPGHVIVTEQQATPDRAIIRERVREQFGPVWEPST